MLMLRPAMAYAITSSTTYAVTVHAMLAVHELSVTECIAWPCAEADVEPVKEALCQSLFDHIPVGVGSQGIIPTTAKDLEAVLQMGMDWSLRCVHQLCICCIDCASPCCTSILCRQWPPTTAERH